MDDNQLAELFLPHLLTSAQFVMNGGRLVHYTSADAAHKIITGKQVWLRNAELMNDFSEMRHGLGCLQSSWQSPAGLDFRKWIEGRWPGLEDEVQQMFNSHAEGMTNATFIISLSEHDADEDDLGRLSMWRAYGGRNGVAIVMNPTIFVSETNEMNVFSTPVIYKNPQQFQDMFEAWASGIKSAEAALESVERERVLGILFYALRTFVLATKHPGFREEREWRVFHSPTIDGPSPWLDMSIETLSGVPQHVVKVNLWDDEEKGVIGAEPAKLINRIIIGPCESPLPIRASLQTALISAGVAEPESKIWMSFIPLRHRD